MDPSTPGTSLRPHPAAHSWVSHGVGDAGEPCPRWVGGRGGRACEPEELGAFSSPHTDMASLLFPE